MPKKNPLVRILFSALLLGTMFYFVRQQQPAKTSLTTLPSGSPSAEGSGRFSWVPRYPGVELAGIRTQRTADQTTYGFQFEVKDDFAPALSYYESQLKSSGFRVTRKGGGEFGAALHAEDASGRLWIDVTAGKIQQVSEIDVTAVMRHEF